MRRRLCAPGSGKRLWVTWVRRVLSASAIKRRFGVHQRPVRFQLPYRFREIGRLVRCVSVGRMRNTVPGVSGRLFPLLQHNSTQRRVWVHVRWHMSLTYSAFTLRAAIAALVAD